jgi:xylono-1,5-lactonase
MTEPRSVWHLAAELGEGPVWVEGALWFVDIKKQQVHRFDPESGGGSSWDAPEPIGFLLPARNGGFVTGLQSGLYLFDPESGEFTPLAEVEPDRPGNRINDGVVGTDGCLWFGTMDNGEREKSGSFYCYSSGRLDSVGVDGVSITNGPAISPDGRILYWVDTLGGKISACDIFADGTLGTSRPFVLIAPDEGYPDGPTIDSEGHVWIGLYGGWEARRYSPMGTLVERVRFPVANITKIAFGGADLKTAYATTARQLLTPEEIKQQPLSGDLFEFRVDVPGLACPSIAAG